MSRWTDFLRMLFRRRASSDSKVGPIVAFVRDYDAGAYPRIRYAGSSGLRKPSRSPDDQASDKNCPNLALRNAVILYVAGALSENNSIDASFISDELLADLFVAHLESGVALDHGASETLATAVLERGLYPSFAHAYSLCLGMDQGFPLEAAIGLVARRTGRSPLLALVTALEEAMTLESNLETRSRLEAWVQRFRERRA